MQRSLRLSLAALLTALVLLAYPLVAAAKAWPPAVTKAYSTHCLQSALAGIKGQKLPVSQAVVKKALVGYCHCTLVYLEAHVTVNDLAAYEVRVSHGKAGSAKIATALKRAVAKCIVPLKKKLVP